LNGRSSAFTRIYQPFENLFRFVAFTEKLKTLDILSTPVPQPEFIYEYDDTMNL
jgi:hypothetical protein